LYPVEAREWNRQVTRTARLAEQTLASGISQRIGDDFTGGGVPAFKAELPGRASKLSKKKS